MKQAKFLVSHFDAGVEKYKAGETYDLTDETRLCIARGAAVEVDVEDAPRPEVAVEVAAAPAAEAAPAAAPAPTAAAKKK